MGQSQSDMWPNHSAPCGTLNKAKNNTLHYSNQVPLTNKLTAPQLNHMHDLLNIGGRLYLNLMVEIVRGRATHRPSLGHMFFNAIIDGD